jgi:ankyrin repeat protein
MSNITAHDDDDDHCEGDEIHFNIPNYEHRNFAQDAYNGTLTTEMISLASKNQVCFDNYGGYPTLYCASWKGKPEIVQAILDKGADVDDSARADYTPLMGACINSQWASVHVLINAGANVCIKKPRVRLIL